MVDVTVAEARNRGLGETIHEQHDAGRQSMQSRPGNDEDFEIPPYLRLPENGTRPATEHMIARIDNKIFKLANLGLRPHPNLLNYRQELIGQLDNNGPYRLRVGSVIF